MNLKILKNRVELIIDDLKNHGKYPKENNLIDYKLELNFSGLTDSLEIFLRNFAKDIISFSNGDSGIILIGINEDKTTGLLDDIGLDQQNIDLLNELDLNLITQKFEKITKVGVSIDLQMFQISTRIFYYLLIEKQNNVLVPINNFPDYKLIKGDIIYRSSSKNIKANASTVEFNRFLQVKANEKSKDFMEIWSKLLPEMVDINPREVLIINPMYNKVYGFNGKDNILSSSDIEIDKTENGIFNVILNAISAGEIGKITTNEGKPLYKIVGEIKSSAPREFIYLSTLQKKVQDKTIFKFTNQQLKATLKHLGWVNDKNFKVENPPEDMINESFYQFLWVEALDSTKKVVFSVDGIDNITEAINNVGNHVSLYNKRLDLKDEATMPNNGLNKK